jgi:hypothetical protein
MGGRGLIAPLGWLLATRLDHLLAAGVSERPPLFVLEPRAVVLHLGLVAAGRGLGISDLGRHPAADCGHPRRTPSPDAHRRRPRPDAHISMAGVSSALRDVSIAIAPGECGHYRTVGMREVHAAPSFGCVDTPTSGSRHPRVVKRRPVGSERAASV